MNVSWQLRLLDLWDRLEDLGATVERRDLDGLTPDEVGALAAYETERHRVLGSPEAIHHTLPARVRRRHELDARPAA